MSDTASNNAINNATNTVNNATNTSNNTNPTNSPAHSPANTSPAATPAPLVATATQFPFVSVAQKTTASPVIRFTPLHVPTSAATPAPKETPSRAESSADTQSLRPGQAITLGVTKRRAAPQPKRAQVIPTLAQIQRISGHTRRGLPACFVETGRTCNVDLRETVPQRGAVRSTHREIAVSSRLRLWVSLS